MRLKYESREQLTDRREASQKGESEMADKYMKLVCPDKIRVGEDLVVEAVLVEDGKASKAHLPVQFYLDGVMYGNPEVAGDDGHALAKMPGLATGTHVASAQVVDWAMSHRMWTVVIEAPPTKETPKPERIVVELVWSGAFVSKLLISLFTEDESLVGQYTDGLISDGLKTQALAIKNGHQAYNLDPDPSGRRFVKITVGGNPAQNWEIRLPVAKS